MADDGFRKSYLAVLVGETVVYEELSDQGLVFDTTLAGHSIHLVSAGYEAGKSASIQIDGAECAFNQRGLNIVLFDQETGAIADSAFADSY